MRTVKFIFDYPVFLLAGRVTTNPERPGQVTIENPVTLRGRGAPTALAMFTDRDGAEQFRDRHAPGKQVAEITTEAALLAVLRMVRPGMEVVALDPFRLGVQARVASIDEILATHATPAERG